MVPSGKVAYCNQLNIFMLIIINILPLFFNRILLVFTLMYRWCWCLLPLMTSRTRLYSRWGGKILWKDFIEIWSLLYSIILEWDISQPHRHLSVHTFWLCNALFSLLTQYFSVYSGPSIWSQSEISSTLQACWLRRHSGKKRETFLKRLWHSSQHQRWPWR